jgi:sugar/nucleoside kinase (ribokinase family)
MDVLGIGTPIIDYIVTVSHAYLAELPGIKGGSMPIDYDAFLGLIQQSNQAPTVVIGGSATNTIKGLACLGRSCAFFGKIGTDEAGKLFHNELKKLKIVPYLSSSNLPTAQVLCLVSPDYERTMRSYLGAGLELKAEELTPEIFQGVKIVHIEGYLLANEKLLLRAMKLAEQADAKVSFDLSSVEITRKYADSLLDLIHSHVDILFANEHEAFALTGKSSEESCSVLKEICDIVVIKMGNKGNWAVTKNNKIYQPAFEVSAMDSTGAGDLFASGFLHGYLSHLNLEQCSLYGALVASEVVQIIGADIPAPSWERLINKIRKAR